MKLSNTFYDNYVHHVNWMSLLFLSLLVFVEVIVNTVCKYVHYNAMIYMLLVQGYFNNN